MDTLFFYGECDEKYALTITKHLGVTFSEIVPMHFNNTEYRCKIVPSVHGKRCVVISQLTDRKPDEKYKIHLTVNERFMRLIMTISALACNGATDIILVIPHFVYSRQDKKDDGRVPIGSAVIMQMIKAVSGTTPINIITTDLHAGQTQSVAEALHIRLDNLYSEPYMVEYIRTYMEKNEFTSENVIVVSPDAGGVKRAERIAEALNLGCVTMSKSRCAAGIVSKIVLNGEVNGKICVVVDDMVDTCGTIIKASEKLKEFGAHQIIMIACHGILSNNAIADVEASCIDQLVITDTVDKQFGNIIRTFGIGRNDETPVHQVTNKIRIVSISWLFARAIYNRLNKQSVSELFKRIMISDAYLEPNN
jgi:ribose-phosphate pyrophosphokinase